MDSFITYVYNFINNIILYIYKEALLMEKKDTKKIILKVSLIILILLAIIFITVICIKVFKTNTPPQILGSGENIEVLEELPRYELDINSGDCLSESEIAALMDLEEYSDNEKMVYIKNDSEHYAEIWKIKVDDEDKPEDVYDLLNKIYLNSLNQIESGEKAELIIDNRENRSMFIGGNVATLIISDCLNDAKELTDNWLK